MSNTASYIYSAYSFISNFSLEHLLKLGNPSTDGDPIPSFDENLLLDLCAEAQDAFKKESNILYIDGDVFVVGDIHGSLHDLMRILNFTDKNESKVLFLGDYIDRGCFSLECITILFALKVLRPDSFFLIRGNHEIDAMCSQYGFKEEILNYHNPKKTKKLLTNRDEKEIFTDEIDFDLVEEEKKKTSNDNNPDDNPCDEYFANRIHSNCYKYTEKLYDAFVSAFSYLPIGAIVNKYTFCIHGGICPSLDKVENLNLINRPITDFDENSLFTDVVWSDPAYNEEGWFTENQRGRGHSFNGAATVNFLKKNSLKRIIRAHQCVKNGTEEHFNQKCITVFSASSYCKPMSNRSGLIKIFQNDDNIEFFDFDPLIRLKKVDALYYKVQALDEKEKQQPRCFSINPARIMLKCSTLSFSSTRLIPNSIENKSITIRSRIPHYNSVPQGDINLDIGRTSKIKKTIASPALVPRIIARPVDHSKISQVKRKTHDIFSKLTFTTNEANLLSNEQMSRSISIPDYNSYENDLLPEKRKNKIHNNNDNNEDHASRRRSLPLSKLEEDSDYEINNEDFSNTLSYLTLKALPNLKSPD